MKLPFLKQAVLPREKITEYLLSPTHPDERSKADFFVRFGFRISAWEVLAEALLRYAADHEVRHVEKSPFGTRYVVEGILHTPDQRMPQIRAVWFVEREDTVPRFVTAYPLKRNETT